MIRKWKGVLCQVNTWTDDDRIIEVFEWRDTPMTMRAQFLDNGGHSNATPSGAILEVSIVGDNVMGSGEFSATDAGVRHAQHVEDGSMVGVSVDPCRVEAEDIIIAGDGTQVPLEEWWAYPPGAEPWPEPFRFATIYHKYVAAAVTGVAVPAFAGARIEIVEDAAEAPVVLDPPLPASNDSSAAAAAASGGLSTDSMVYRGTRTASKASMASATISEKRQRLLASSAFRPPVAAFRERTFDQFTPWTLDEETGYISGHAYPWFGRHRGFRQSGATVTPPASRDFTQFLNGGWVTCDDGSRFQIGVITHKGGHGETAAEYEVIKSDPANQLGPVVAYADDYGVQVCGIAWPDIDPVEVSRAMASYPSGDWQFHAGEQKLHGIALVNNPGFHSLEQEGVVPTRMCASMARVKLPPTATPAQEAIARGRAPRAMSAGALLTLQELDRVRGKR
jgi:hypothetical protein